MKKKAGGGERAAETRMSTRVQEDGLRRAKRVRAGMLFGSECTNSTEPYIVSVALDGEKVWAGEDESCWMGKITVGARYIRSRKCKKGADGLLYTTTDCEFNLSSEDVRVAEMQHSEVEARRSSRSSVVSNVKTFKLEPASIEKLKLRCWEPINQQCM